MPTLPRPNFATLDGSDELVAFNLQNTTTRASAEQYIQFAQQFEAGAVPAGGRVVAEVGGQTVDTQLDVTARWPDGSVKSALVTLNQPSLAAGATAQGVLKLGGPAPGTPLPSDAALDQAYNLQVKLDLATFGRFTIDGAAELTKALAANKVTVVRQGAEAVEVRFEVKVAHSLQLTFDITTFADGSTATQVFFRNDLAMQQQGGAVTYNSVQIIQDGETKFTYGNLKQFQYQTWSQYVYSDASAVPTLHVQHDVDYLQQIGVVHNYDLSRGIDSGQVNSPGGSWTNVLGTNGLVKYMPTTGSRSDIGPTTTANAQWLITQDAGSARYALTQAQAAGTVPWHYYDAANGSYLSVADYPQMWLDYRGTVRPPQYADSTDGWTPDTAHPPDMSYIAYILTGDQYHLEMLNAQAAWVIAKTWNVPRENGEGLVVNDAEQVRAQAWSLRVIQEAAWANPDGSDAKAYFTEIAQNNWRSLLDQIPQLTRDQGEIHGIIPGVYRDPGIAPWQQDFFASTAALAAMQGDADARAVFKWQANFLSGRFLSEDMNPHNGYNYTLNVYNKNDYQQTWAGVAQATKAAGNYTTTNVPSGYYAELALMSQSLIISVFAGGDDPSDHAVAANAMKAMGWLLTSGDPFLRTDLQYQIVPRMPDGQQIGAAEQHVTKATARGALHSFAGDNAFVYDIGVGGARLEGTTGSDVLIDRSRDGDDTLFGASGDDYLIGGHGANLIVVGSGRDYAEGGGGADIFKVNPERAGHLEIGDFELGIDVLRVVGAGGADKADALASAIADAYGNAVLTFSDVRTVTLVGISPGELSAALFG